ncbi:integrase core domain-containing protein [Xenophilus azovorans]|uniref:integrase core domain-containing protein n=1 Tax=Xenophilus azovorans TaxID=151755 RepID=UPI0005714719|nr:integrase core domain-containing protein [Xenophilus azovorans]
MGLGWLAAGGVAGALAGVSLILRCRALQGARKARAVPVPVHAPLALGTPTDFAQPRPRWRHGRTDKLPEWAVEFFVAHYRRHTNGYRKTAAQFCQLHGHEGWTACASTVAKYIRKAEAREEAARTRCRHRIPEPQPANTEWCLDMTGKVDVQGRLHTVLGVMDRGTRACLYLKRMIGQDTAAVLAVIRQLIGQHGTPERIRTDNASVFTSARFTRAMKALGIRHVRNRLASPWQNRIERMFGTLKSRLQWIRLRDGRHLDELLKTWVTWYNHARPHQHLHGWTPAQAWQGVNPFTTRPTRVTPFHPQVWRGLLTGYLIERERC